MRKRGSGKTSARSRRAPRRKSTSARSSSSRGAEHAQRGERAGKTSAASARSALSALIAKALEWHDAHVDFERAIDGVPPDARGRKPQGVPYSLWQLLEHLRLSQLDVLEFCRNPKYVESKWPDDYWPQTDAPPDAAAWDKSVAAFRRDRDALKAIAVDGRLDLFATIPHGSGQTYLRELVLMIDHNAYHIGELVAVRRALGLWR
jgi:DinB family protein